MNKLQYKCYKNNTCLFDELVEPLQLDCGTYICSKCAENMYCFKCEFCKLKHKVTPNFCKNAEYVPELYTLYLLEQYEAAVHQIESKCV